MDHLVAEDTRQRVAHVANMLEEAGSVLGLIPRLLDENEVLRVSLERAQREAEAGREEMAALKNDIADLQKRRDEIESMCTSALSEMTDVVNQLMTKLRPAQTSSPFARDRGIASDISSRLAPLGRTS